ncbi:bifunctional adenosylcobinamide kinase/adenosylcobinamide-phosphate guanylyltransferase [Acuticoccus mangrovi]|uniref:bifunctional adenosylcobinamide kinase/adenosylcobinamide-phosphate guanylyltransferase n=1 Tax=Acuticoccus mangrovi TaxID=2796142 RepID=UPI002FC9A4F3
MSEQPFILVLGGARSGKSGYAERLARAGGRPVTYLATAGPARDAEMAARIAAHQARRPPEWVTLEVTHALDEAIRTARDILLIDCLTLWLTNLMLDEHDIDGATQSVVAALDARRAPVIAVANEVGEGIVPATPLGRAFRDRQGMLNQRLARAADTVVKMVAGYPLVVKPNPHPEPTL